MTKHDRKATRPKAFMCMLLAATTLSAGLPAVAHAQDQAETADAASNLSGEIIVTARKRDESLQSVPIAISAITSESVDRQQASTLKDLSFSVPNLIVTNNQTTTTGAAVYIRGIGQDDSTPVQEQGVAIYVDGVYLPRSQGSLLDLIEFERIEVLRGPQGTLYGRNSTGGAVKFVTKKPDLQDLTFVGDISTGSYNRLDIRGSVSVPLITDTLAVKLDAISINRDGYLTRLSDGQDVNRVNRRGVRGALTWVVSDTVRVDLAGDYTWDRSGMQTGTPLAPGPADEEHDPLFGTYITDADTPDLNRFNGGGVSATIAWDVGAAELRSITAYRGFSNTFWGDLLGRSATSGGGSDIFRILDQENVTQEIQLASSGNAPLQYVFGGFFMYESFFNRDTLLFQHDYKQKTYSLAAYGELTYRLAEGLNITAGGRYSYDRKRLDENAITLFGPLVGTVKRSWTNFSPKLAIDYQATPDLLAYASVQRGYKVGAFQGFPQAPSDLTDQVLEPEKVTSYEVGLKTSLLDRRVTANFSAFYSDYQRRQLSIIDLSTFNYVARTAGAKIYGFEVELRAVVTEDLQVYAFGSTFHGRVKDADPNDPLVPVNGTKLAFTPPYMMKAGLSYQYPFDNGARILFDSNISYKGRVYFGANEEIYDSQGPVALLDAQIGYSSPDDHWRLTAGVQNITDRKWAYTGNVIDAGTLYFAPPRTWSLALKVRI
jgi:iron complex outermembrane receptor protein